MLYNKQFKWQDDLIRNVGLSFSKKDWVTKEIVYHPLKFAKRHMEDVQDSRPIRVRYFASFVLKSLKTKERVEQFKEIYRDYNKYKDLVATCGYDTSTEELFRKSVKDIAIRRIILVDDIYKKGSVIKDQ